MTCDACRPPGTSRCSVVQSSGQASVVLQTEALFEDLRGEALTKRSMSRVARMIPCAAIALEPTRTQPSGVSTLNYYYSVVAQAFRACEEIGVVQAFRPAAPGGPEGPHYEY